MESERQVLGWEVVERVLKGREAVDRVESGGGWRGRAWGGAVQWKLWILDVEGR